MGNPPQIRHTYAVLGPSIGPSSYFGHFVISQLSAGERRATMPRWHDACPVVAPAFCDRRHAIHVRARGDLGTVAAQG